eukprot:scaffold1085_cov407-Prasinococcus_capsulatus_cf.AAC.76
MAQIIAHWNSQHAGISDCQQGNAKRVGGLSALSHLSLSGELERLTYAHPIVEPLDAASRGEPSYDQRTPHF